MVASRRAHLSGPPGHRLAEQLGEVGGHRGARGGHSTGTAAGDRGAKGALRPSHLATRQLLAALELGVSDFDASVGGLGGCPYAPGATGNIATEELVHMVEDMGVTTGIDLEAMIAAAAAAEDIVGRTLPSQVLRAGPRTRTIPA